LQKFGVYIGQKTGLEQGKPQAAQAGWEISGLFLGRIGRIIQLRNKMTQ
jgi:hypothetical protein